MMLNPASSGNSDYMVRFAAVQKQQWNSITRAYTSSGFSVDGDLYSLPAYKLSLSGGLVLFRDVAGDGNFGMYSAAIPLAIRYAPAAKLGTFTFAFEPGILQYGVNVQDLIFDNQQNGQASSGESWAGNQLLLTDFGIGFVYSNDQIFSDADITAGVALKHLNEPSYALDGTQTTMLSRRSSFFMHGNIALDMKHSLLPQLLYSVQKENREWLAGAMFTTNHSSQSIHFHAYGLHFRPGDALILSGRIGWKDLQIGLSYDLNYSGLFRSSRGQGGLEITLQYGINAMIKVQPRDLPFCPTYL